MEIFAIKGRNTPDLVYNNLVYKYESYFKVEEDYFIRLGELLNDYFIVGRSKVLVNNNSSFSEIIDILKKTKDANFSLIDNYFNFTDNPLLNSKLNDFFINFYNMRVAIYKFFVNVAEKLVVDGSVDDKVILDFNLAFYALKLFYFENFYVDIMAIPNYVRSYYECELLDIIADYFNNRMVSEDKIDKISNYEFARHEKEVFNYIKNSVKGYVLLKKKGDDLSEKASNN